MLINIFHAIDAALVIKINSFLGTDTYNELILPMQYVDYLDILSFPEWLRLFSSGFFET